jgi:hypothetical protein
MPSNTRDAIDWSCVLYQPTRIATRKNGKYTEVKEYEFNRTERNQEASGQPGQTDQHHPSQLPTVQQL